MNAAAIILVTAVVGVDTGWTTMADGGFEYVIQIEPQLLESLRQGEDIASDIPAPFRGARRYRITVGNGPLPGQDTLPPQPKTDPPLDPSAALGDPPAKDAFSVDQPTTDRPSWANPQRPSIPLDDEAIRTPQPFSAPDEVQPVAKRVGFVEPSAKDTKSQASTAPQVDLPKIEHPSHETAEADPPSRPWWPLTLVSLVLFASLGGNAYLGWMFAGTRSRYRSLLSRTRKADA